MPPHIGTDGVAYRCERCGFPTTDFEEMKGHVKEAHDRDALRPRDYERVAPGDTPPHEVLL